MVRLWRDSGTILGWRIYLGSFFCFCWLLFLFFFNLYFKFNLFLTLDEWAAWGGFNFLGYYGGSHG